MADWTWVPSYVYDITREGPRVLITRYEDGSESRRVKTTTNLRTFSEKHSVGPDVLAAMTRFWADRLTNSTFTKADFDINSTTAVGGGAAASSGNETSFIEVSPTGPYNAYNVGEVVEINDTSQGELRHLFGLILSKNTDGGNYLVINQNHSWGIGSDLDRHDLGQEVAVRFASPPKIEQVAASRWHVRWEFIEVA
jgi:hypothetical protein